MSVPGWHQLFETHAKITRSAGNSEPSLSTTPFLVNFSTENPFFTLILPSTIRSAPPLSSPVQCHVNICL